MAAANGRRAIGIEKDRGFFWKAVGRAVRPEIKIDTRRARQQRYRTTNRMVYTISIPFEEFRDNFCEDMTVKKAKLFEEYVNEDGDIDIEYSYGDCKNGISTINWCASDDNKTGYTMKYGGSSTFAMWWSGVSDDVEEEQDKEASKELKETIDALIRRMHDREWNLSDEKYKAMMGAMEGLTKMFGVAVELK